MRSLPLAVMSLMLASTAAPQVARADDQDPLDSVFSDSGYRLERDERLFALFAAFNVAGFDRAEESRSLPFPHRTFHPIRQALRDALLPLAEKLRPGVDQYLDAHPATVEAYVDAALTLEEKGDSFQASAATPAAFAGLDQWLTDFAKAARLAKLGRELTPDYRAELKRLRGQVDAPFADVRAAFKLKEEDAPTLVLFAQPLDGPGNALARRLSDGTHVVVFGLPAGKSLDLRAALRSYAGLLAAESTEKVALDGLKEPFDAVKAAGAVAPETGVASLVTESLLAAAEAKFWSPDAAAAVEAAQKRGLFLTKEFLKALGEAPEAFPVEKGGFAAQVVGRVNGKALAAEYGKQPTAGSKPRK
jgi:hypothetical protein